MFIKSYHHRECETDGTGAALALACLHMHRLALDVEAEGAFRLHQRAADKHFRKILDVVEVGEAVELNGVRLAENGRLDGLGWACVRRSALLRQDGGTDLMSCRTRGPRRTRCVVADTRC
jgi:hypothetical protein